MSNLPNQNFYQVGTSVEAGTPAGINIFKSYMEVSANKTSKLPNLDGAQGFDPEADSLILVFQSEEAAQSALSLLSSLI